ncbi:MAG: hypothetical protein PHU12_01245 [Candidatus Aenigmarchaeota archaeon]|nr:hypothetical protein [Candidatus Aenigmarchaeota archaeon]
MLKAQLFYTVDDKGNHVPMCPGCTVRDGFIFGGHRCNYILKSGLFTTPCDYHGVMKDCQKANPKFPKDELKEDISLILDDIKADQKELEAYEKYCQDVKASA